MGIFAGTTLVVYTTVNILTGRKREFGGGWGYWRNISRSWSPFIDMFSRDWVHLMRSVEKKAPARDPKSTNWETVRRSLGDGLRRRLYGLKMSCGITPLLLSCSALLNAPLKIS